MKLLKLTAIATLAVGFVFPASAGVIYFKDGSVAEKSSVKAGDGIVLADFDAGHARHEDGRISTDLPDLEPSIDQSKVSLIDFSAERSTPVEIACVHIGDANEPPFVPQKPIGIVWEKKFKLEKAPEKAILVLELLFSSANCPIYVNGQEVGKVLTKSMLGWKKYHKQFGDNLPFVIQEIPLPSGILQDGENSIKIESKKEWNPFLGYDDFMIQHVRVNY